jgi:hypothetical protein
MSDLEAIIQKLVRQELHEQMPGIIARALANDRNACWPCGRPPN